MPPKHVLLNYPEPFFEDFPQHARTKEDFVQAMAAARALPDQPSQEREAHRITSLFQRREQADIRASYEEWASARLLVYIETNLRGRFQTPDSIPTEEINVTPWIIPDHATPEQQATANMLSQFLIQTTTQTRAEARRKRNNDVRADVEKLSRVNPVLAVEIHRLANRMHEAAAERFLLTPKLSKRTEGFDPFWSRMERHMRGALPSRALMRLDITLSPVDNFEPNELPWPPSVANYLENYLLHQCAINTKDHLDVILRYDSELFFESRTWCAYIMMITNQLMMKRLFNPQAIPEQFTEHFLHLRYPSAHVFSDSKRIALESWLLALQFGESAKRVPMTHGDAIKLGEDALSNGLLSRVVHDDDETFWIWPAQPAEVPPNPSFANYVLQYLPRGIDASAVDDLIKPRCLISDVLNRLAMQGGPQSIRPPWKLVLFLAMNRDIDPIEVLHPDNFMQRFLQAAFLYGSDLSNWAEDQPVQFASPPVAFYARIMQKNGAAREIFERTSEIPSGLLNPQSVSGGPAIRQRDIIDVDALL